MDDATKKRCQKAITAATVRFLSSLDDDQLAMLMRIYRHRKNMADSTMFPYGEVHKGRAVPLSPIAAVKE